MFPNVKFLASDKQGQKNVTKHFGFWKQYNINANN